MYFLIYTFEATQNNYNRPLLTSEQLTVAITVLKFSQLDPEMKMFRDGNCLDFIDINAINSAYPSTSLSITILISDQS